MRIKVEKEWNREDVLKMKINKEKHGVDATIKKIEWKKLSSRTRAKVLWILPNTKLENLLMEKLTI